MGRARRPGARDAIQYYFDQHKIDISLGYCSSRVTTPDPKFVTVELPESLRVSADYGLSILRGGAQRTAAFRFALFVLTPEAQAVLGEYGFTPVTQSVGTL